jgi:deoxycytidine triphosphate deaminase
MILSNEGIKEAIAQQALVIDPTPGEDQYTTSAVNLTLGTEFRHWDESRFAAADRYRSFAP